MKPAAKLEPEPESAAKPDTKPKPLAVAPAKKHTVKTDQPVDDDDPREGPSPKSEAKASSTGSEANIDSFSLKDLWDLRKDCRRQPDESIISWLVRLWDAAGEATILDSTEAKHLGSLSHDPVIDCYFNNGTYCEEMTPGDIFPQPFTQLFGPTPPVFEGFRSLNANDIIQWLVLLVCLFCLAFKDKGRLTWITTLIPTLEDKDTIPQPDPAPQPASGINHPDWVKEIREMGQMLREYLSPVVASLAPAGGKPCPCPDKGESDGAAAEPTDVTTVQVPAEPQGQPQPAAVAPVETKKYKVKSEHPGNKDKKGGPSQPGGESEVEIITESLTYESLHNLQKDLAQRGREAYTAWLLRVWDLIGTGVQLNSSEARNLGPLTQDSGVNQLLVREPGPLSLWERLLMSVWERFVHRDRMQEHQHRMRWKTLEEGIQQLREVAVLEVLFGRGGQHDNDPDKVRCTGQMLWNLATLGPSQYATFIATIHPDNNQETVGSVANKLRNYESMISGPMQAQVSAVAKELREKMEEVTEEIRRWAFGIAAVEAEGIKKLNSLSGLSENPSAVGLLKVEEQRVPVATSTVHRQQYRTNRDAVIPIHKMICELESQGVVSKTHSPFNSPIWPVRKSEGNGD
ncbi:hypothetical protein DUI87_02288 [Hirundo rustica rustica]|uniref:Core shell protein Gag P30 domain-containing protein n=1 Tax=Hirundo rustica rustica TaxID=333673 RepID=A0A3M0L6W6_HIRRU|nr:hypothetical protein DUI87_02288 [Hirundo rustica rustica]